MSSCWHLGDSCTNPLLPMRVKFGVQEQTQVLHLHGKFHGNLLAFGGQKPQFLANFDFWGLLYRSLLTDDGQILCGIANSRHTLACQNSSRSVYSVALWRRKTSIFAVFGLRHLVLSIVGSNLRQLNTDAQLQTFPYPRASKSFLCSQRLRGEI